MSAANSFWATLNRVSLVKQIIIGLLLGTLVGYLGSGSSPLVSAQAVAGIGILGNMFVGALKDCAGFGICIGGGRCGATSNRQRSAG